MKHQHVRLVAAGILAGASLLFSACAGTQTSNNPSSSSSASRAGAAVAAPKVVQHEYTHGSAQLDGYFALPGDLKAGEKRPGILVVHAWMGIDEHVHEITDKLAKAGFVAFACDIYGKGIRPTNPQEASAQATIYRSDRALQRARANAGLEQLKQHASVDASKVVAIGYCFGGGTVLELARSGADLQAVVSFHGNLDTPQPENTRNLKASVFVMHGADDPHVPGEHVQAFQEEMRGAGADWALAAFGNAVHSFTDRAATRETARYEARADRRSWQMLGDILQNFTGRGF